MQVQIWISTQDVERLIKMVNNPFTEDRILYSTAKCTQDQICVVLSADEFISLTDRDLLVLSLASGTIYKTY